jgi:hypothetical protein
VAIVAGFFWTLIIVLLEFERGKVRDKDLFNRTKALTPSLNTKSTLHGMFAGLCYFTASLLIRCRIPRELARFKAAVSKTRNLTGLVRKRLFHGHVTGLLF